MYLQHVSSIKHPDGLIDINIIIINKKTKEYTYTLSSEFLARQFHKLYRKGRQFHGKALTILNKSKIKGDLLI